MEFQRSYPNLLTIDLSNHCNLRCGYCCFFGNPDSTGGKELETGEWLNFIRSVNGRVFRVVLRGGEAMLHPGFREIVSEIAANRMRFRLLTNGILLNESMCRFLAETRRCERVKLSLDGPPELHDFGRGEGSCAAALRAIGLLRKYGVPYRVTVALHRHNYRRLEEIVAFVTAAAPPEEITWSVVSDGADSSRWALRPEEVRELARSFLPYLARYPFANRALAGALRRAGNVERARRAGRKRERPFRCCRAMESCLGVRADGGIVSCLEYPGEALGRVNRDSLEEVWRQSRSAIRAPEALPFCRECRCFEYCSGGCPLNRSDEPNPVCPERLRLHFGDSLLEELSTCV